jgi:hypothetical protein
VDFDDELVQKLRRPLDVREEKRATPVGSVDDTQP